MNLGAKNNRFEAKSGVFEKRRNIFFRYALAVAAVAVAIFLRKAGESTFGLLPTFIVFYPAVILSASFGGIGPGILATFLSALSALYWYFSPNGHLHLTDPNDVLALCIFTVCGISVSIMAERLRRSTWAQATAEAQELQLRELNRLNEELSQQSEELAQQNEELTQQSEELSQQTEELAQQNEELQTQSEEIQSLYAELTHREGMLQMLLDAARLSTDEQAVLDKICLAVKEMFGPVASAIIMYEVQGDQLAICAQAGFGANGGDFPLRPLASSFAEFIIAGNKTACLRDTSLRPDLTLATPPNEKPFQAVLASPLREHGMPNGVVAIYSREKQDWTVEQFRLAEWLAVQSSHILETLRLQTELRRLYDELEMIFDSAPAMIWYKDTHNNFVRVNRAAAIASGLPQEAIEGKNAAEIYPGEAEHYFRDDLEVIDSGQPKLGIVEMLEIAGGEKRWILTDKIPHRSDRGEIIGVVVFALDITERKRAEAAICESEERFREMFEHIHSGVGIFETEKDGEDFLVKEFNPAAESALELPHAEAVGRRLTQIIPNAEEIDLLSVFQRVWRTGKPEHIPPQRYHDERLTRWLENYIYKLPSGDIVAIFDDITEQIRDREHVDLLRMQLMHAGRLTAMGELASGIAHEINQPLTVVTTWADVVKREIREKLTGDQETSILALHRISDAIERAGKIVNRMKNFARRSDLQKSLLSMKEVFDEVYPLVEHQLRIDGVETTVQIDETLPLVMADRAQIQQVLLNLIRNAHDAMMSNGYESRSLKITGRECNNMLQIALEDTGSGISPEMLEPIFEPFHTTKSDGMGLGLSICRTIIENHGGRIWARCNPKQGATVSFTLPLTEKF